MQKKPTNLTMISIKNIVPDENQPRKYFDAKKIATLRISIKRDGILNPLIVEPIKGQTGKYRLIDGERRFRAATEEGLKEVPYVVIDTESEADRLLQQFQIQELHEGWSAVEKAFALERLSQEMHMTIPELGNMLGLPKDTMRRYAAFSGLADKSAYLKNEVPIDFALYINSLKTSIKKLYHEEFDRPFNLSDEKDVEKAIIKRIKDGTIKKASDIVKIKDSITKNPAFIVKFMETDISPESMFHETKAKGAFHLRNIGNHSGYLHTHINRFLELKDVKLSESDIVKLKGAAGAIKKLLNVVE